MGAPVYRGQTTAWGVIPQYPPTLIFLKTGLSLATFLFVLLAGCRAPGTHLDLPPHCSSCGCWGLNSVSRLMQPVLCAAIAILPPQNLSKFLTMYVLRNVHFQSPCVNAPFRQNCRPVRRPIQCCQTLLLEKRERRLCSPPRMAY